MTFSELGLQDDLLKGLNELGFENPTPIQEQSIPTLLEQERDLVALAQTGTGKTAGFGLPMLHNTEQGFYQIQSVVLSPTRELGNQIAQDLMNFSKYMKGIRVVSVYGGANISTQIREIKKGCNVLVATPGRLVDLIKRKVINLSEVDRVVLDEADEMLNMGFKDDLDFILDQTPAEKSTWLFSATMAKEVERIAATYMEDPIKIKIGAQNEGAKNIEHKYYLVKPHNRFFALKRIVDAYPDIFGLIFCRTKRDTQEIADRLIAEGYNVDALHGDLSQQQRDRVMDKFRDRNIQLLCATDVAARGIDVSDITHVINYELPEDIESYTHRSGRTARAGKKGESLAIITPRDQFKIGRIEKIIKKKFEKAEVPNGEGVMERQLFALVDTVKQADVYEDEFEKYADRVYAEFAEMDKEEVIRHFISRDFNRFIEYYKDSEDINLSDKGGRRDRKERDGRSRDRDRGGRDRDRDRGKSRDRDRRSGGGGAEEGFKTIFINAGITDGLNAGKLIDFVCNETGVRGRSIGKIRMNEKFAFFEVKEDKSKEVLSGLTGSQLDGRKLRVEFAKPRT